MTKLAVFAALAFAVACGDDDGGDKSNNNTNTNNTTNNNTSNNTNNNTTTNNTATQCTAVGQDCVVGEATNAGFVCADDGLGATCLRACTPPADGDAYPCTSGQVCAAFEQGGPSACIPSQCGGFQDSASCDAYNFENGGLCFPTENDNFLCFPAGKKTAGAECEDIDECAGGLLCFDGKCEEVCKNDGECTGAGERCLGDTEADFLNAGAGLCVVGCDSYSPAGCPTGTGCFPITVEDGLCVPDTGDGGPMADCTPAKFDANGNLLSEQTGCQGGLSCIQFTDDATKGTCVARCNGAAASQTASDATCPGQPGANFCFNLADAGEESPSSGICLEHCTAAQYGSDHCTNETFGCTPFRGERHVCLPVGTKAVGETCESGECAEGSYCLLKGDGTGTCTSFCDTSATPNGALACDTNNGETCDPIGNATFAFGRCGFACDQAFADTDCPAGLQNCLVDGAATTSFCSASGSVADGAACGSPLTGGNACTAGSVCSNEFSVSPFSDTADPEANGICREACAFGGPADQCGTGKVCAVDFLSFSTGTGLCESTGTNMANTANGAACPEANKPCGPNGSCLDNGNGTNSCIYWCEVGTNKGCAAGQTCSDVFGGAAIGVCR